MLLFSIFIFFSVDYNYRLAPTYDAFNSVSYFNVSLGVIDVLISPNYPSVYPNELRWRCIISNAESKNIKIEVKDFLMEADYDYVYIGDGTEVLAETIAWGGTGETNLRVFISQLESVWVSIESDSIVSAKGFVLYLEPSIDSGELTLYKLNYHVNENRTDRLLCYKSL